MVPAGATCRCRARAPSAAFTSATNAGRLTAKLDNQASSRCLDAEPETGVRSDPDSHTTIGLLGNIAFVAGSLLFLDQQQHQGTLFFITGSVGILIGNLGNAAVMAVERRWKHAREQREHSQRSVAPR